MSKIKLIAADMDHTLLTEDGKLPPRFDEYVDRLEEQGVTFAIASGRPMYTLLEIFKDRKDSLTMISDNGGAIWYKGKMIYKSLMEPAVYQEMIRFVEEESSGGSVLCAMEQAYGLVQYRPYEKFFRGFMREFAFVENMRELDVEANKFTIFFPKKDAKEQYEKVFEPRYGKDFSVTVGGDEWVDIMNKGIHKGAAMQWLGKTFDVKPDEMMAFGDTYNDIEMLQIVKYSYVMENAALEMRQYGNFVAPSNEEYGVLQVIEKEVLSDGNI
ncbi:MAG: Cof-type HAD-IIB family hydrolase [Lachnospiraceae bacterium]